MSLEELAFSDLFVAEDLASSWFKVTPDSLVRDVVPDEFQEELMQLRLRLDAEGKGKVDFKIDWPESSGVRLRARRMTRANGKTIYVCRRPRIGPASLRELGMPRPIAEKLLDPKLEKGLVIFLGRPGAGKTTSAASFIMERLRLFGGVCWTIENPAEMMLDGPHGDGICYQTEVERDDDIGLAMPGLYRSSPNILFIGEVRDAEAARQAILAANSGVLVVLTFHGNDLLGGLGRFARLAAGNGNESEIGSALADGLSAAIHVELHNYDPRKMAELKEVAAVDKDANGSGTPPRILAVRPLWISGTDDAAGLRSMIREGDFQSMKSAADRQRRAFMMGNSIS